EARMPPDLDPPLLRARLGQLWSSTRAAVDSKELRSMWLMRPAPEKPALINIEFDSPRAAEAAVARLRAAGAAARLRPNAFIEAVGGEADRVEMIPSAATESEAEQLARRVDEAMRTRGFRPAHDAAANDRR